MSAAKDTASWLAQVHTETIPLVTIYAITAAILTGVFIIATVGFAGPEILHNTAHDIRHGLVFPCH